MRCFFHFSRVCLQMVMLLCLAASVQAQVERYVEGVHYTRLPDTSYLKTLESASPASDVLEVFWYGCGSCNAFEPLLNHWVTAHEDTVNFTRSPMIWNDITEQHARVFFTAQELGVLEQLHEYIFAAIHQQHNTLQDENATAKMFAQHGVEPAGFSAAWQSFAVDSAMRKAKAMQRELGVRSVPTLVVNGRFQVNVSEAVPGHAAMLDVVDFLLARPAGE